LCGDCVFRPPSGRSIPGGLDHGSRTCHRPLVTCGCQSCPPLTHTGHDYRLPTPTPSTGASKDCSSTPWYTPEYQGSRVRGSEDMHTGRYSNHASFVGHQCFPSSCSTGECNSPGAISLNAVYGSADAPGGRPYTPEAGMWHSFSSCAMLQVAQPLLRTAPSPARDPPMAHGQRHKPRQPMWRRQPHRGSRGQPSGTVAAASGQIAPAIHSTKTCPAELQLVRYLSNAKRIHRIHVYSPPRARPHTRLAGSTTPRLACSTNRT
jgi:hypothetical protein